MEKPEIKSLCDALQLSQEVAVAAHLLKHFNYIYSEVNLGNSTNICPISVLYHFCSSPLTLRTHCVYMRNIPLPLRKKMGTM